VTSITVRDRQSSDMGH